MVIFPQVGPGSMDLAKLMIAYYKAYPYIVYVHPNQHKSAGLSITIKIILLDAAEFGSWFLCLIHVNVEMMHNCLYDTFEKVSWILKRLPLCI